MSETAGTPFAYILLCISYLKQIQFVKLKEMFTTLFLVGVLTICWIVYKVKRRHIEKCAEKIPGDKGYPLIGNALSYNKNNTHDMMKFITDTGKRYHEYGIHKAWIGCVLHVVITDPKYMEILANSPYAAEKGPVMSALLQGLGKGVFATTDIPKWKVLRKVLTKRLTRKNLENEYHPVFVKRNKRLVEYLKKRCGKELNVKKEFKNHSTDIFSEAFLGVETNEVEEPKFRFLEHALQFIDEAFGLSAAVTMFKAFEFLQHFTKSNNMKKAEKDVHKFLAWILEERMKNKNLKRDHTYYTDFLLERKIEQNLTTLDIEWELYDVVFAGTDTSAVILSAALLFLAMFPDIQEEAYQEQVSIFGENSIQEPTTEDIASMVYLTRVVKEALRFCSPPMIVKYTTGDVQLDNYTIPKGTIVTIDINSVCSDERYWEKPKAFYPDHFLPEKEAERPPYAFPVFGFGPRICPGVQFGMTSIKTTLSFILRTFKVSTSEKFEELNVEFSLMREYEKYMVNFEERTGCNSELSSSL